MQRERHCPYCAGRLSHKTVDGRQRLSCERCRLPLYKYPVPATCVVATDERGQILLVKRCVVPKIGQWCLPGGFIKLDESPERAALRELEKQTGLRGKIELLLGATTSTDISTESILTIGYLVTRVSGEPLPGDNASQLAWFHPSDLPPVAFRIHRHFIRTVYSAYTK